MSIDKLATCCREERRAFQKINDRYSPNCVELFRKAFAGNQQAWTAIKAIFEPLIRSWIGTQQRIDAETVQQDALLAFYRYAPARPNLVITADLGPVLQYLCECTKTSLLMVVRKEKKSKLAVALDSVVHLVAHNDIGQHSDLRLVLDQRLEELLSPPFNATSEELEISQKEQLVFYWRFVYDIGPKNIYAENSEVFTSYQEVATIVQRLTRRLRNDNDLKELAGIRQEGASKKATGMSQDTRQNATKSALLKIALTDNDGETQNRKGQSDMSGTCKFDEVSILDYITGIASVELRAAVEQSPACIQAAQELANDIGPLLAYLNRYQCPDVATLVAYQQSQIVGTQRLVLHRHIEDCPHCREELATLHAVDEVATSPQPGFLRQIVKAVLRPALASPQPLRGELLIYETPQIYINLSTRKSMGKQRTWLLKGQVRTSEGELFTDVLGLHLYGPGEHAFSEMQGFVDEKGFFTFIDLAAGNYRLVLMTSDKQIEIPNLAVGVDD